jgi:5-methylcytosine-specific restriction endonuclease McrA
VITAGVCAVPGCPNRIERYGRCAEHALAERRRRHQSTRSWRELRQRVLARAAGRCERCGDLATDAHHVVARVDGGPDSLANLTAVCETCHQELHRQG